MSIFFLTPLYIGISTCHVEGYPVRTVESSAQMTRPYLIGKLGRSANFVELWMSIFTCMFLKTRNRKCVEVVIAKNSILYTNYTRAYPIWRLCVKYILLYAGEMYSHGMSSLSISVDICALSVGESAQMDCSIVYSTTFMFHVLFLITISFVCMCLFGCIVMNLLCLRLYRDCSLCIALPFNMYQLITNFLKILSQLAFVVSLKH